jgi:hypothetical protein
MILHRPRLEGVLLVALAAMLAGGATAALVESNNPAHPHLQVAGLPSHTPIRLGPPPTDRAHCRGGNPLAGVYKAARLKLISPCRTAEGFVVAQQKEPDGDTHLYLLLDPGEGSLLSRGNDFYGVPALVVEIIPQHCGAQLWPSAVFANCADKGGFTSPDAPATGSRVAITGPWVYDRNHDWNEIHPVWWLRLLRGPGALSP